MEDDEDHSAKDNSPPRPRLPLPILVGMVLGIGLAFYVARRYFGDPSPPLTAEKLQAAEETWAGANIRDYRVEVAVVSRQKETYAVEVLNGRPVQAWRNGNPLKQLRTFDTWSLPGIFETIHSDLSRQQQNQASGGPNITLRCTFDERTGAPRIYRRIEFEPDIEVSWVIEKLESLESGESLFSEHRN